MIKANVQVIHGDRVGARGSLAVGCSAAVMDPGEERILLVRRADNGRWAVPGGYMEAGENLSEACAREVWEETGLRVAVGRLIGVYTDPNCLAVYKCGRSIQLVVFLFEAEKLGGELRPSKETTDVGFYSREEMAGLEIGDLDRLRIADALAQRPETVVRDSFGGEA